MEDSEKANSEPIPTNNEDASTSQGKSCALCGCATPAVRCDRCNSQIFCLSCDDMYHRHPKRKLHLRKAVDSIWSTARSPRLRRRTDLPGDPCKIPIPPPRSKKRERHTIGGRIFLKSGLELGSFGHSKVFDPKSLTPVAKDFYTGQKSPASLVESNCEDDTSSVNTRKEAAQIYENDNVPNQDGNLDSASMNDQSPWNPPRPNISSPIQVSIPSSSPDIVNGQSFGYPAKPQSQSASDLSGHPGHAIGHHPYHFHPPYPYMHPPMHPPYSHSMAHLNCAQCISSSWSNLMSPHPSPYFHPMPWGSAQNTMSRGQPYAGPMKHSHGDLASYPDSNFHYPYPGGGYYHNGPPVVDPNFIKDLHEHAELQKLKKRVADSNPSPGNPGNPNPGNPGNPNPGNPGSEDMDTTDLAATENEASDVFIAPASPDLGASRKQIVHAIDEAPVKPEKPTEPWECIHCTYINPPGIHVCEVCCKTSFGGKNSEPQEEQSEARPMSRDSESPLINRDALLNSPDVSGFKGAQKDDWQQFESDEVVSVSKNVSSEVLEAVPKLTTETQTSTTTKSTDVQTHNIMCKSIASSTDSIFPKQEISVQTEVEAAAPQNISVATDPMISSHSLESLLSGVSAPPYHNRKAGGWGRGSTSFSTQSLYERGRSRSPMPRSHSSYTDTHGFGRDSSFASEEAMHSLSQAWLYSDPMYFKPHNQDIGRALSKEDYFDGTWGSMDKLNRRVKQKKESKLEHPRPKLHRSLDDLKSDKRPEMIHAPELVMLQIVKEAERCGFTVEDLRVAYLHCGKENPVFWLEDNWPNMIKNVIALAAKYGEDNEENDVGAITPTEAKEALRIHHGDLWDAVTECIENRQRKILELTVRGNFTQKQIAEALRHNEGNVELAYADLIRVSTRRHKFILSPGLSEDSEDLNLYNPAEDSIVDRHLSPLLKPAKQDVSVESKTEKKKSDFLTKLSAIREAQSERRKAREEKELIRESITQEFPSAVESEIASKDKEVITPEASIVIKDDLEKLEEKAVLQEDVLQNVPDTENKIEEIFDINENKVDVKENTEDNMPVDFGTNWGESQGEWIEEYSDEQWEDEGDANWVGLGKKFQKMEKEFEEEAMQMAALWEKEELEDDVFEEEIKDVQPEGEASDTQKKFDDWVKANLKVDSSEYEEEEAKEKIVPEDIPAVPVKEDIEVSHPSPLQHYPTEHDLSLTSQLESDWVNLPADSEIEKLAHDIICEGSDVENKFDKTEMISYEDKNKMKILNEPEISDEDWEKIELDEQLQEMNELDSFTFPDKDLSEVEKSVSEMEQDRLIFEEKADEPGFEVTPDITSQVTIQSDSNVAYKNIDLAAEAAIPVKAVIDAETVVSEAVADSTDKVVSPREKLSSSDGDQPRPPVRRKSKLNSAAIEQALKNQEMKESALISSDIPPALPEKTRNKEGEPKISDIYAVPDKTSKLNQQEPEDVSVQSEELKPSTAPEKPPRLSLSPISTPQGTLQRGVEEDKELQLTLKAVPSKDASPVASFSNESDSNCFADSESDTEIKRRRQKFSRKPAKYENSLEEVESIPKRKFEKTTLERDDDFKLEPDFDFEDDDIDPALIEPLPPMKSLDFDPELPIPLAGRGSRLSDLDDVDAPKAFREDTTRPLQLFKAVKRETPTNTLNLTSADTTMAEDSVSELDKFRNLEHPVDILRAKEEPSLPGAPFTPVSNLDMTPQESAIPIKMPDSSIYENQAAESYYYNEAIVSQLSQAESQLPYYNEAVSPQMSQTESQLSYYNEAISPQMSQAESQLPLPSQTYEESLAEVGLVPQEIEQESEQAIFPDSREDDEINFMEMEGVSAAVDYFFGRYNEVTVTPPKKKAPARAKSTATVQSEAKTMSTSEIIPSKTETPPLMERSATAALETAPPPSPVPPDQSYIQEQQIEPQVQQTVPTPPPVEEIYSTSQNKVSEPVIDEYLPFAEDYLFGCYNQVIIPKKPKKKPVALPPIPKFGETSTLGRTSSIQKEQKPPAPTPSPELPSPNEPEQVEEAEAPETSQMIVPSASMESLDTSAAYDDVFHDLPAEMLSNQSFDDTASIYYESFQDAVEDVQMAGSSVDSSVVNVRAKTVHFEEPEVPVVPPRKRKTQVVQKTPMTASSTSTESYADEYLYRQYGQYDERSQSKKKTPSM